VSGGTIAAAALLDLTIGDPPSLPHPVVTIGHAARRAESFVRLHTENDLIGGGLVTLAIVAGAAIFGAIVERAPFAVRVVAAASTLACGSLLDHAAPVRDALECDDIGTARLALARLVGRDTRELDEAGIARAVVESLAESTCDGIVAPLLFLCVLGLPGAFAYKAINTLDSLIGHIEPPYTWFGRIAARLDDLANFVPARMSAALIAAAAATLGESGKAAVKVAIRDGGNHRSPNAGVSEAAMAGALGVRLGGSSSYDGIAHDAPLIGAEFAPPSRDSVRRAMCVTFVASLFAFTLAACAARACR